MRFISFDAIIKAVELMCLTAAFNLPEDVLQALKKARESETSPLGRSILEQCLENARIAQTQRVALCQDTGVAVFFVEIGEDVKVEGGHLYEAIQEGTRRGYQAGFLRKSIVRDPIFDRTNTQDNTPAIIHIDIVSGDKITIFLAPKGGGAENMSALKMLKPLMGKQGVMDFVVDTVVSAGGNTCPPVIVGVGVGGNFEKVAYLAKKSLLRTIGEKNPDPRYADFEAEILEKINASGLGPQGLGGVNTALAVHILTHPCHIASLPVAVNINCHSARHAKMVL
ncbi:MAG: fumarate hydratase [Gammaproteobacteria bacterium GWE2_42_36]|nr:MAG: fumarate hydratase [Gammaproteobacteria bacterium GWE2_42_36]HCU04774.1 fumarate hydratase [Coxiellaceae bacterium]